MILSRAEVKRIRILPQPSTQSHAWLGDGPPLFVVFAGKTRGGTDRRCDHEASRGNPESGILRRIWGTLGFCSMPSGGSPMRRRWGTR